MRVYIAATLSLIGIAARICGELETLGVQVVSTWHRNPATANPKAEEVLTFDGRRGIANTCLSEVESCDVLVMVCGPNSGARHGFAFETGYAAAHRKTIVVVDYGGVPATLLVEAERGWEWIALEDEGELYAWVRRAMR